MIVTFARTLEVCLETRLFEGITSLWPNLESARKYWRDEAVPLIEQLGLTPIAASLSPPKRGQTPGQALLTSLGSALELDFEPDLDGLSFYHAIEGLLAERWERGEFIVLCIEGIENWQRRRWHSAVCEFRAFVQAHQDRLFMVYLCTDREKKRRLFFDVREPLYRSAMSVVADEQGLC